MIVVAVLGLFASFEFGVSIPDTVFRLDAGVLLWGLGTLFYMGLDWRVGGPFGLVLAGLYFLGRAVPVCGLWGLFIAGWVLQGVGHAVFEKKSPAFFKNGTHLLIGPIWIFSKLLDLER